MERKTKQVRKAQEDVAEVTAERDERSAEVSDDAQEMLNEIECCLAEAELDQKDEKARAKAEWEAMDRSPWDQVQRNIWMAKYAHLFEWCCGEPVFD